MTRILLSSAIACLLLAVGAFGQKGIDTQTTTIKQEGNKVTPRPTDVSRDISWGKGKTKVRELLPNPYKLNSRRDVLMTTIIDTLKEQRILVDEAASRLSEGIIVTQPFVFAKGTVVTQNELNRYGVLDVAGTAWTRAQYTLTIEVQSIDGVQNNVSVNAKIEGRAGNGLIAEWVTVRSSGVAEDEFLAKLIETVTGVSPEPKQDSPTDR